MRIALCVSVPDGGVPMLRNLVESAAALASGKHTLELDFTYNSAAGREAILAAGLPIAIGRHHFVEPEKGGYPSARSATHSHCINALYAGADADIAIICDYDIAFVAKDWDRMLAECIIGRGVHFFGSPYSATDTGTKQVGGMAISSLKYQQKPNAIFLAFSPAAIKPMAERICDYARFYNGADTIALKFIATRHDSACYRLPIGSFVTIDTGYRVAELIEERQLRFESLARRVDGYRVVRLPREVLEAYPASMKPEEYDWQGEPFVVHFRKASLPTDPALRPKSRFVRWRRSLLGGRQKNAFFRAYTPQQFFEDVTRYIRAA